MRVEFGVFATHSGAIPQVPPGALVVPRGVAERVKNKG